MEGMAVASTVESMATNPVLSITEMSTGPRSERNPTAAVDVELTADILGFAHVLAVGGRRLVTRVRAVALAVAWVALSQAPSVLADPNALWSIVDGQCVPDQRANGDP